MKLVGCSFALFLSLAASIAFADGTGELVAALQTLQSSDVTFDALGRAYKMRTNAPNTEVITDVVRACAAGLLYANRQDFYTAQLRPRISDVDNFERSLCVPCTKCNGQGKISQSCPQCGGNGKCKSFNCQDGQAEFKGLNGRVDYRPCPACKGTGNCPKCNGSGTAMSACTVCMGRGGAFSGAQALTVCREYTQRALSGMGNSSQGAPTATKSATSSPAVASAPARSQSMDSRTIQGMPQIPVVRPPPDVPSNPQVKAVFDKLVKEYYAKRMQEFGEHEKCGWTIVNGLKVRGDENSRRNIRATWFDVPGDLPSAYWEEAERIVEGQNQDLATAQYEKNMAAKRIAEAQSDEQKKRAFVSGVEDAILRAESQQNSSSLLADYFLSADDALKAMSTEYTTVRRKQTLQELWDRAMQYSELDIARMLFAPFPSGIKYAVEDVRMNSETGNYVLTLEAIEARPSKDSSTSEIARGTCREIGRALRKPLYLDIGSPTLIVPADDPEILDYQKGQVILSGEWIIPIIVTVDRGLSPYGNYFRSEDEFDALTTDNDGDGPPASFFPTPAP